MIHGLRNVLLGLAVAAFVASSATAQTTPLEINAILSTTGTGAALGAKEEQSLKMVEAVVNRTGGVRGRPIHIAIVDAQSSPQVAVQLATAIIAKHPNILIGPSIAAMCSAVAPLVEKNGPADYCLSPGFHPIPGGYVFSAGAGSSDLSVVQARFYREHGWTRIAEILSTDATGQDWERVFGAALALPENRGVQVVALEHFNAADLSVAAQVARIKAANPQAIIAITTGTPLGTVLHALHDAGLDVPVSTTAGNMLADELNQFTGFLPKDLYFPTNRGVLPEPGLARGPVRDAQTTYFTAFKAIGVRPEQGNALAWDPSMILIDALRHLGADASADQVRAWIQGQRSWSGIYGTYDFAGGNQRGVGANELLFYRWNPATSSADIVSKIGGMPK